MYDDAADILGGDTLPIAPSPKPSFWSGLSISQYAVITGALLGLYIAAVYAWNEFLRYKEKSYKLSMRRKHGIPDNDHRPFSVAYAAVLRARQEREAPTRPRLIPTPVPQQLSQERDQRTSALPEQSIRQRKGPQSSTWSYLPPGGTPAMYNSVDMRSVSSTTRSTDRNRTVSSESQQNSDRPASASYHIDQQHHSPSLSPAKNNIKHGLDDEGTEEQEYLKKSRTGPSRSSHDVDVVPKRGAKRYADEEEYDYEDEDEAAGPSKRKRDKRQRKVSLEHASNGLVEEEDMILDEEEDDQITDLKAISRGKKRDRAEAGSTFGGDDSAAEEEQATSGKSRRKRRTFSKRKSDAGIVRGQKREREDEDGSEDSDDAALHLARTKRGKKVTRRRDTADTDEMGGSDISMDDSIVSSHPSCKGRRVGEQWKSNGVLYKVGSAGERLRQALIREERHKFHMPEDSQHPDRDANLEVIVEVWLTDDEYKAAMDQQLLAWQDSTKPSAEPETSHKVEQLEPSVPPPAPGKDLLWQSPLTPGKRRYSTQFRQEPAPARDPFRQSIATNIGLRVNPFQQPSQPAYGRRVSGNVSRLSITSAPALMHSVSNSSSQTGSIISSADSMSAPFTAVPMSLSDSTNSLAGMRGTPRRGFSKWEKQDMEAEAMRRMREASKKKEEKVKQESENANAQAKSTPPTGSSAFALGGPTAVPAANTPASLAVKGDAAAATAKLPIISFGVPPAATQAAPSISTSESKDATKITDTKPPSSNKPSPFGFSAPSAKPSLSAAPPLATAPADTSKPAAAPAPLFAAPPPASNVVSQQPASSSTPASSGMPNFFAKPAAPPSAPASTAPAIKFVVGTPGAGASDNSTAAPASNTGFTWGAPPVAPTSAFGEKKPETPAQQPGQQAQQQSSGGSLLNRLGGFAQNQASVNVSSTTAAPAATPSSTTQPKFSFGKSGTPASVFGSTASTTAVGSPAATAPSATQASTSTPASGTAQPKFNFFTNKSATPAADVSKAASAAGGGASAFGFGPPVASTNFPGTNTESKPTTAPTNAVTPAATTTPKFTFGATSSGSAFMPKPAGDANATQAKESGDAKPPFGGLGFGTAGAAPPFGGAGTTSAFGGGAGTGGVLSFGSKPADQPQMQSKDTTTNGSMDTTKSAFGAFGGGTSNAFGSGASPSPFGSTNTAAGNSSNSTFGGGNVFGGGNAFGGTTNSTPAASSAPSSVFGFGATNNATTPAANSSNNSNTTPSSFGAPAGHADSAASKAAFGFAASTSEPNKFKFVAQSTPTAAAANATAPTTTTPAATPSAGFSFKFGQPTSTPSNNPFAPPEPSGAPGAAVGSSGTAAPASVFGGTNFANPFAPGANSTQTNGQSSNTFTFGKK